MIKDIDIGPSTRFGKSYDEAIMFCFSLDIDGKKGWRLPTRSEWLLKFNHHVNFTEMWYQGIDTSTMHPRPSIMVPVRTKKENSE